jgi:hypothetical protein
MSKWSKTHKAIIWVILNDGWRNRSSSHLEEQQLNFDWSDNVGLSFA